MVLYDRKIAGKEGENSINDSQYSRLTSSGPWVYFAVAFGITWLIEFAWALSGISLKTAAGQALLCLAASGPAVAAIILNFFTRDKEGRRDYWQRIIDVKRISVRWYLVIFLIGPVLYGIAALLDIAAGGSGAIWGKTASQLTLIPALLTIFLTPFFEELGWRGYALQRLQARWNALISSLILSVVWAMWHIPLSFIQGTYQHSLGIWSAGFWVFVIGFPPMTLAFTWIFNNTRQSTLAAILLHCAINGFLEMFTLTQRAYTFSIAVWYAAAIAIVIIWGPKKLMRG